MLPSCQRTASFNCAHGKRLDEPISQRCLSATVSLRGVSQQRALQESRLPRERKEMAPSSAPSGWKCTKTFANHSPSSGTGRACCSRADSYRSTSPGCITTSWPLPPWSRMCSGHGLAGSLCATLMIADAACVSTRSTCASRVAPCVYLSTHARSSHSDLKAAVAYESQPLVLGIRTTARHRLSSAAVSVPPKTRPLVGQPSPLLASPLGLRMQRESEAFHRSLAEQYLLGENENLKEQSTQHRGTNTHLISAEENHC